MNGWIPFIIWLAIFCWLLPKSPLFSRVPITEFKWRIIILLKAMAVPVAIGFYASRPGALDEIDAGRFFNDAIVLNDCAFTHPGDFFRVMTGMYHDTPASPEHLHCLQYTNAWDEGSGSAIFYHDNRIVIRLHTLLDFFCARSFAAHSLFACMISLMGAVALFHSLKNYFAGREWMLLLCIIFFPSLWFYTAIVSKESPAVAVMGLTALLVHRAIGRPREFFTKPANILFLLACMALTCMLKAYLLVPVAFCLAVMFFLDGAPVRRKVVIYFAALVGAAVAVNAVLQLVRGGDIAEIAENRRRHFATSSQGGIFLIAGDTLARVDFDTNLVKRVRGSDSLFTIRANVPYKYWEDSHHDDTLYCEANPDTQTVYSLAYIIRPGHSNIAVASYGENGLKKLLKSIYYSLLHPFFINAEGVTGWLASLENLLLVVCALFIVWQNTSHRSQQHRRSLLLPVAFGAIVIVEALLIGYTAPNAGAISRYRSPAVIFILLAALYFYRPSSEKLKTA